MVVVVTGATGHIGANLVPRARAHHAWYRQNFPDYPKERRALVPGGMVGCAVARPATPGLEDAKE